MKESSLIISCAIGGGLA